MMQAYFDCLFASLLSLFRESIIILSLLEIFIYENKTMKKSNNFKFSCFLFQLNKKILFRFVFHFGNKELKMKSRIWKSPNFRQLNKKVSELNHAVIFQTISDLKDLLDL